MGQRVKDFAAGYPFEFDEFQTQATLALGRGESVLVASPTGSGKTVVGEFAVWLALQEGGKAFYTTPLKALSNQKFGDFIARHGARKVGLLTGDNSINPHAPVVVMTTEVLRNMIYERSDLLHDLRYVVLDEVHYLQDPYRGAVWEEVIIHLPLDVKIVSLSATVSNAEEFSDWIQTIRGTTATVLEDRRPVPLRLHYLVDAKLVPMFIEAGGEVTPNPQITRLERGWEEVRKRSRHRPSRGRKRVRRRFPDRTDVIETLNEAGMLPAIYFIFSRRGCDAAVERCVRDGLHLNQPEESRRVREFAEMRCAYLDENDLEVLGYSKWVEALSAGIASHHAGLLPVFKETVEELFKAGLVKAVFATETLSLGINMPARTVVIESLVKFTGERHEVMTAGEFTQLTGRAGRRSIDVVGHAVVLEQSEVPFRQITGLATATTYPLLSSFQPSYNMATNLVRNYSREEANHLLNSSFAQYRIDKEVVVDERTIERNEAYLASYRDKMVCDRGDFYEYWAAKEKADGLERSVARTEDASRRARTRQAMEVARPGQVLLPGGRIRGPVVVVKSERSKRGEPRLLAVTRDRRLVRLSPADFRHPPRPVANIRDIERSPSIDQQTRRRLASALVELDLPEEPLEHDGDIAAAHGEFGRLKTFVHRHPCHKCPDRDRHAQWAERASRLERQTETLKKRVRSRTETLSRTFEKVLSILESYEYVDGFDLTSKGATLAKIYNENDLLVAEVLAKGWLDGMVAAEVASLVSTFVFESRGPFEIGGRLPTRETERAYRKIVKLQEQIKRDEETTGLELTRGTEAGFADVVYEWCRGADLEEVLYEDVTPGDFIRSAKQTLDLLRQLRETEPARQLDAILAQAIDGVNRGVVAYTGIV